MKNKKHKKILSSFFFLIVFVIGILVGNTIAKHSENKETESSSQTTQIIERTVGTQTIENTLTSSGEVSYSNTEKLKLKTSKYFKNMCVETDDIVQKGEKILKYSDGTYLKATYDCLISSYSVPETGNKCTSSNYVEVHNIEDMIMNLSINESDINKVKKGQEVTIKLAALDDKTYTGEIKSVDGIGTYSTSGASFAAVVSFENDGNIKPGMSANCSIVIEKAEDCIAVPINAVQTSGENKYVVVVDENNETKNINIETGISNDSYVEVISGLSGGETIQMVEIVSNENNNNLYQRRTNRNNSGGSMEFPSSGEMPEGQMPSGDRMPNMNN